MPSWPLLPRSAEEPGRPPESAYEMLMLQAVVDQFVERRDVCIRCGRAHRVGDFCKNGVD